MKRHGFTLLELLIILVVLGIVMTIGYLSMRGWITNNQLREAVSMVASDLERARGGAWRRSVTTTLTFNPGGASYVVNDGTSSRTVTLPNGAVVSSDTGSGAWQYSAPYAEFNTVGRELTLSLGGRQQIIRMIGLTGKVVR